MEKLMFISSSGGHFSELKRISKAFKDDYNISWVVEKSDLTTKQKHMYFLLNNNAKRRSLKYFIKFLLNALKSVYLFIRLRPAIIITTGANPAIVMMFLGKLFKKKTIFIETAARVNQPSKTGLFLHKICGLTIVQWESLKDVYPGSVYGGLIF